MKISDKKEVVTVMEHRYHDGVAGPCVPKPTVLKNTSVKSKSTLEKWRDSA
jgi:hypothetical protein